MISLDDVVDYLQNPHKYDGYIMALCEFHDDHNPSMMVSKSGYRCKSCGVHGSLVSLYEKVSGRHIAHQKREYNPAAFIWRNWRQKFGGWKEVAKIAHQSILWDMNLAGYLFDRKLTEEDIRRSKIGYLDGYFTFPIKDNNGEIVGIVARASKSIQTKTNRYSVSPDCPVKLFTPDWRAIQRAEQIYVCYGTIDSFTLIHAGYSGLTGISGQELNSTNLPFRKPIYIIPDKKEERSALFLQSSLGWRGMSLILDYPDDCKDLNDIEMKYGIEKVKELIETKKEKYIYG